MTDETNTPETMEKTTEKTVGGKETAEELAKAKSSVAALWETVNIVADARTALASVAPTDIPDDLSAWRTWKGTYERITKQDVADIVNKLQEPYNSDISDFIKKRDIKGMQEYLNKKIDDWEIDKVELENYLSGKKIRFDGHILVDWKFGPQTLYTMKFIIKKQLEQPNPDNQKPRDNEKPKDPEPREPEKPTAPETREELPDLSWIPEEMDEVLDDVFNTNRDDFKWDNERNLQEGNPWDNWFNIDASRKRISLATWGKEINGEITSHVKGNRCELDWEKGIIYVICDQYEYEMPVKVSNWLELDQKWYPKDTVENRKKVNAFTKVWNLMNMLKANYVFNWWNYSFEHSWWDIEYNNGVVDDTEIVSGKAFDAINNNYATVWVNFGEEERRDMACLLNAMKYDVGKLTMDEIEDGCTDADVDRSKHFSKKFAN